MNATIGLASLAFWGKISPGGSETRMGGSDHLLTSLPSYTASRWWWWHDSYDGSCVKISFSAKPDFALLFRCREQENRWWRKEPIMSRPVPAIQYQSRREVIDQMAPRYHESSLAQKVLLLDTVVART